MYPHQVSKTAPTGEYLTVGSFMIRGKKNFLPPHPLIMGFGLLFRLDESSLGSHLNERRVRGEDDGADEEEEAEVTNDQLEFESESDEATDNRALAEAPISQEAISEVIPDAVVLQNGHSATNTEDLAKGVMDQDISITQRDNSKPSNVSESSAPISSSELDDLIDRALVVGTAAMSSKKGSKDVSKYSVAHIDIPENENDSEEAKGNIRDKPYISKAERRKLKKGQNDSSEQVNTNNMKEKAVKIQAPQIPAEKKVQASAPVIKVRGQKGKLKKMKEKYADQDEEERRIRMEILAVSIIHHN